MGKFGSNYDALAHHWVYNSDNSECYDNRMFSEYDKIYSYGRHFLIAQKIRINNETVYLINSHSASVTTSKQQWKVKSAIPRNAIRFTIPNAELNHKKNIEYYFNEIECYAVKESRAKSIDYKPNIISNINTLNEYIELFKPDKRKFTKLQKQVLNFDLAYNIQDLIELLTGVRNERVRVQKKKERIANKKVIAKAKEDLKLWLNFKITHLNHRHLDKVYLRYSKVREIIETSNSAHITLQEAKDFWMKAKRVEKLLGQKVGNYSIVKANGTFTIGCTELTRGVMNDMCKQLNLEEVF